MNKESSSTETQNEYGKRIEASVKWYRAEQGYGFLVAEDGQGDIFLHFSALGKGGYWKVDPGDRLVCEIDRGPRGRQVVQVLEVKPVPRISALLQGRENIMGKENAIVADVTYAKMAL